MTGPLSDLKILDLTHLITGPFATKLLADFGADVIKVERPGGDPARGLGPFPGGEAHPEKSGTFFYFNTNKRSLSLNLAAAESGEIFGRLVDWADVVVESLRPGVLNRLGCGWDVIHARRPEVPLVSITNFGQDGPYADFRGSEVVLWGFGGEMYSTGLSGREPVKMYGTAGLVQAGAAASTATLAAAMVGIEQGIGQFVDFAITDALFASADRRHSTVIGYEFSGKKTVRRESEAIGLADGVFPCADGWVEMHGAARRYERISDMLGNPEWAQDPRWQEPATLMDPFLIEEFNAHLQGWLLERTKREVWAEGRRARVMCTPLFTMAEIFDDPHFRGRGFFAEVEHSELGHLTVPGRPLIMSESPWELRRPAPMLGEHTREILGESGYSRNEVDVLLESGVVEAS